MLFVLLINSADTSDRLAQNRADATTCKGLNLFRANIVHRIINTVALRFFSEHS